MKKLALIFLTAAMAYAKPPTPEAVQNIRRLQKMWSKHYDDGLALSKKRPYLPYLLFYRNDMWVETISLGITGDMLEAELKLKDSKSAIDFTLLRAFALERSTLPIAGLGADLPKEAIKYLAIRNDYSRQNNVIAEAEAYYGEVLKTYKETMAALDALK